MPLLQSVRITGVIFAEVHVRVGLQEELPEDTVQENGSLVNDAVGPALGAQLSPSHDVPFAQLVVITLVASSTVLLYKY